MMTPSQYSIVLTLIAARTAAGAAQAPDTAAYASVATREVRSCATAASPGMEVSLTVTVSFDLPVQGLATLLRHLEFCNCIGVERFQKHGCKLLLLHYYSKALVKFGVWFSNWEKRNTLPVYYSMVTTR